MQNIEPVSFFVPHIQFVMHCVMMKFVFIFMDSSLF
jgi:hypothetical protein